MSDDQRQQERREYFRIKNWIILNYEVVDSLEVVPDFQSLIDDESPRITLLQELTRLENENQAYLKSLQEKQSQLGDYLLNMNKKFELLTRFVIQSLTENSQELTEVDISGGGIRFSTKTQHEIDTLIKMEIVLVPECVGIIAYGRVVDCQKAEDSGKHNMAVVFVKLREADRDAIVKHVFKIQSRQLRQNAPNPEETDN